VSSGSARFTAHFVRNPVLALVVNLAILVVGIVAYTLLPVRQYPRMESSSLIVETVYIGASAADIQSFVTIPIERAAAEVDGVDYVDATSVAGMSTVTVHLRLDTGQHGPLSELTARLMELESQLPDDAEPPIVRVQRADRPYATFYPSLVSETLDPVALTALADQVIQPQLATIPGVQRVGVEGARTRAMRVWLDADRMAELAVSPSEVWRSLSRNNFVGAVGRVESDTTTIDLVLDSTVRDAEAFRQMIVRDADGAVVRLADVASVELGAEAPTFLALADGKPAVFLSVWPTAAANEIEVAHELRRRIEAIDGTLPGDTTLALAYDGAAYMEEALHEIRSTLVETVLIVGFVVFLFLGSMRSAFVPLIAIPVSLIGAVALMALMGFSLNLLTVLAIVLAVGLVVDDAIVVVENVERHVQAGRDRLEAARLAAEELAGPVVAMTITLAAVYAPIAVQGGLTGALFREFSLALAAAVLASGVVALTLAPLLSARLAADGHARSWLARQSERAVGALQALYGAALGWTLARWPWVLASAALAIAALPALLAGSTTELAPTEDQGSVGLYYEAAPNARIEDTYARAIHALEKVHDDGVIDQSWTVVFGPGGFGGLELGPHDHRKESTASFHARVGEMLAAEPGLRVLAMLPAPLPGAGNFDVELVLTSTEAPERMARWADELVGFGWKSGLFAYVDTDTHLDRPVTHWGWDRDALADLGADVAGLGAELGAAVSGAHVNRFDGGARAYKVIAQYEPDDRLAATQLADITLSGAGGTPVHLASVSSQRQTVEPRSLQHFQQLNAVRVRGAVAPGVSKDTALSALEAEARRVLPAGYALDYAGESRQLRQEGTSLFAALGLALVLVYLVLAAQFRSFRDPLVVLAGSVPLALAGALVFTYLGFTTINVYSQVGLVTLVGLVAKNGILIVEFANERQKHGLDRLTAVHDAALQRFRPILMTTAATVFGHLPLVLVTGAGAAARNSIGTVLVSGMLIGTVFTLFVVPSVYVLLGDDHRHDAREVA
jgi:multidrug efflux pump